MMTLEEAEKELIAMLEEAEGGPSYSIEEVDAYMRELLHPKNQIYLTGDTHGQFERIISFCERQQVQPESTFIILGDVGLNYYGDRRDNRGKDNLTKIPITFFCIHGNHEMRPTRVVKVDQWGGRTDRKAYRLKDWHGGRVYVESAFPSILFARDGEVYDLDGQQGILVPGSLEYDAAREIAANMGTSMNSSINISTDAGAQIASDLGKGVIQGVSQYISKRMRTVKITLKAGHRVLLHSPEK